MMKAHVCLLLALVSSPVSAAEVTVQWLLSKCATDADVEVCDAYIQGVVGGIRATQATSAGFYSGVSELILSELKSDKAKEYFNAMPIHICLKPDEPFAAIKAAVLELAGNKKRNQGSSAHSMIFEALYERYGCHVYFK